VAESSLRWTSGLIAGGPASLTYSWNELSQRVETKQQRLAERKQPDGDHDWLLLSKLMPPPVRARLVPRPRLVERLDEATRGPLTLVAAPAGFAKTSLLVAWTATLEASERRVAWLTLDEGDNDPLRFWRTVATALQAGRPELDDGARAAIRLTQPLAQDALAQALLHDLSDRSADHVLVFDDYHAIDAESIHSGLTQFLERLPPNVHLVIASRVEPPLPLARLRARGQLVELGVNDLRFTGEEAAEFFGDVMGLLLAPDQVAALEVATEGWPAGLQLAGLALQGRADPAGFIETFAGTNRYVLDYLVDEVLQLQSEDVQAFLGQTAILDRLSGPLCNAVTERADSQAMLEQIERANLFLVPLDDERCWYRYHRLFAEALRARSSQLGPGEVPESHQRASTWLAANGFIGAAIQHALAAGNAASAGVLVERAAQDLLHRGEVATLRRWMDSLPPDVLHSRPRLVLARCWSLVAAGHAEEAAAYLQDVQTVLDNDRTQREPDRAALLGEAAAVRAHAAVRTHDWENAIALSQQALAQMPEGRSTLRAMAALNLGTAYRHAGQAGRPSRRSAMRVPLLTLVAICSWRCTR